MKIESSKLKYICIFLIFFSFYTLSCKSNNREKSQLVASPSQKYFFETYVKRASESEVENANVYIKLFDGKKNFIAELSTGAGDFNKWAIAWHPHNDTLIMKSSDIGSYAWKIINDNFEKIELDSLLYQDAKQIFESKYRQ